MYSSTVGAKLFLENEVEGLRARDSLAIRARRLEAPQLRCLHRAGCEIFREPGVLFGYGRSGYHASASVDLHANVLTLAASIARAVGDRIWVIRDTAGTVRVKGSAPDVGALESDPAARRTGPTAR